MFRMLQEVQARQARESSSYGEGEVASVPDVVVKLNPAATATTVTFATATATAATATAAAAASRCVSATVSAAISSASCSAPAIVGAAISGLDAATVSTTAQTAQELGATHFLLYLNDQVWSQ